MESEAVMHRNKTSNGNDVKAIGVGVDTAGASGMDVDHRSTAISTFSAVSTAASTTAATASHHVNNVSAHDNAHELDSQQWNRSRRKTSNYNNLKR